MSDPRKGQEPSMEEILSSIRQIIADEEGGARPVQGERRDASPAAIPTRRPADDDDDVLELTDVVERPAPARQDPGARQDLGDRPEARMVPGAGMGDQQSTWERAPTVPAAASPRAEPARAPDPRPHLDSKPDHDVKEDRSMAADQGRNLVSDAAASASSATLARLSRAANPQDGRPPAPKPGSPSIEQFMIELMTPLLKDWLDANLPTIVERVVENEVKKLARRAENF